MTLDVTHGWRIPDLRITQGDRLKAARREADITAETMAEMLGVSRRTIVRWERDDDSAPPIVVIAYSVATEVNLGWLQTGIAALPTNDGWAPWGSNPRPADYTVVGSLDNRITFADFPRAA
jgi:DNA-binding XRE family transcriptional regulator